MIQQQFRHCSCWKPVLAGAVMLAAAVCDLPASERDENSPPARSPEASTAASPRGHLILVVGAPGNAEYDQLFRNWAARWQQAAVLGELSFQVIGLEAEAGAADRELLQQSLTELPQDGLRLWLVLSGHGTFDGRTAKFNLRGEDITADELGEWLSEHQRPVAVIGAYAASAPLLEKVSGTGRVVISSTRSAAEVNFSRFGGFLIDALLDPTADLDKDQQVSLLEAFLRASRKTQEFYEADGRLETEHPLLDDNGDGLGVRSTAFRGVTPTGAEQDLSRLDGPRAHQWHLVPNPLEQELPPEVAAQRDRLELEILALKARKTKLAEADYYEQLEQLLLQLAELTLRPSTAPTSAGESF